MPLGVLGAGYPPAKICYIEMPATGIGQSSEFCLKVFG
jgi:hypothetical protein